MSLSKSFKATEPIPELGVEVGDWIERSCALTFNGRDASTYS